MSEIPDLEATLQRAHAAWRERWRQDDARRMHYRVSFDCDAKAFGEVVGIAVSALITGFSARFDAATTPAAVIEFDCTYEVWEGLRKSFEGVPSKSRRFRQEEKQEGKVI